MKYLGVAKKIVVALLIVSIAVVFVFEIRFHALTRLILGFSNGWNMIAERIFTTVIELVAIIQCVNLSLALYVLRVLDKHLMPMY